MYRRNFIRLIDKAVREYQEARNALVAQVEERQRPAEEMASEGRFIYIFSFVDHLENCVNATRRLLHLLERIKSDEEAPAIPRLTRRLIEANGRSVVQVRNLVEHIDKTIQDDEIRDGEPVVLVPSRNGHAAAVAGSEIRFADMATVIRNLHEVAGQGGS